MSEANTQVIIHKVVHTQLGIKPKIKLFGWNAYRINAQCSQLCARSDYKLTTNSMIAWNPTKSKLKTVAVLFVLCSRFICYAPTFRTFALIAVLAASTLVLTHLAYTGFWGAAGSQNWVNWLLIASHFLTFAFIYVVASGAAGMLATTTSKADLHFDAFLCDLYVTGCYVLANWARSAIGERDTLAK